MASPFGDYLGRRSFFCFLGWFAQRGMEHYKWQKRANARYREKNARSVPRENFEHFEHFI
jgi:hypothetical protein